MAIPFILCILLPVLINLSRNSRFLKVRVVSSNWSISVVSELFGNLCQNSLNLMSHAEDTLGIPDQQESRDSGNYDPNQTWNGLSEVPDVLRMFAFIENYYHGAALVQTNENES